MEPDLYPIRKNDVAMFSPKELEGEVDHSFFDSDGEAETGKTAHQHLEEREDDHVKKSGRTKTPWMEDENKETENEKRGKEEAVFEEEKLKERFSSLQIQSAEQLKSGGHPSWMGEGKAGDSKSDAVKERKESEREDSDVSYKQSSHPAHSDKFESSRSSQSDDSSSICSYSSIEPRSDSSADERDGEGVLRNDETESDDENGEHRSESPSSKCRAESSKTSAGKPRSRSRSSSSEGRTTLSGDGRSPAPLHLSVSQASPQRRPQLGSPDQRERTKASETEESEDTVTDVTPLSTPDVSPGQSFDLTAPAEQQGVKEESGQERSSDMEREDRSVVLSAGRRVDSLLVISSPSSSCAGHYRKNYSFTNEEVRRIDRENQRLLRELSASSARSRRGGSAHTASTRRGILPTARLYHSALNRQRDQVRIQRENLAFLKRLESVKPTPGMTRSEQLADYQRQAGYLGIPAPIIRPSSGRGSRPSSTTSPHRIRPKTAKPSRSTAPRPAWS